MDERSRFWIQFGEYRNYDMMSVKKTLQCLITELNFLAVLSLVVWFIPRAVRAIDQYRSTRYLDPSFFSVFRWKSSDPKRKSNIHISVHVFDNVFITHSNTTSYCNNKTDL